MLNSPGMTGRSGAVEIDQTVKEVFVVSTPVSSKSLPLYYRTIATCLQAGFNISQSLKAAGQYSEDQVLRECTREMYKSLLMGNSLSSVCPRFPRIFDDVQRSLIQIGEGTGNLAQVFKRLADISEARYGYTKRLQSSLVVPFVALAILLVLNVIAPRIILPPVYDLLNNFGMEMPAFSQLVFGAATFLTSLYFWLPAIVVAIVVFKRRDTDRPDQFLKKLKASLFKIPVLSRVVRFHVHAQWARLLSLQLEAGCLLPRAIENLRKTSVDPNFDEVTRNIKLNIINGDSLADSMRKVGYFDSILVEFVQVGQDTGELPAVLEYTARLYEQDFQSALDSFETLLSPIVTLICGLVVGAWVIAFVLPLAMVVGQL